MHPEVFPAPPGEGTLGEARSSFACAFGGFDRATPEEASRPLPSWAAEWPQQSFADASSALALADHELKLVEVNSAFERATGMTAEQLVGRPVAELWHGDHLEPSPALAEHIRAVSVVSVDAEPTSSDLPLPRGRLTLLDLQTDERAVAPFGVELVPAAALRRGDAESSSQESFQLSFDQLTVGMMVCGIDGRILHVNGAMCRLIGRSRAEVGTSDASWVHHDDQIRIWHLGLQALAGEINGWSCEKRLLHADGHVIWVLENSTLVTDAAGQPMHFLAQFVDISGRKQAEEALRESESRTRFVVNGMPVALVQVGPGDAITGGNDALVELLGQDPVGRSVFDVIHSDDHALMSEAFQQAARTRHDWEADFRIVRPDGTVRWVRARTRMHVGSERQLLRGLSAWRDVTAEIEARFASERFHDIVESVEDVVAICDEAGCVMHLNAAGRAHLPFDVEDDAALAQFSIADLFLNGTGDEIIEYALPTVRHFGSWKGEGVMAPPGFEPRNVSAAIVAHYDQIGRIEYLSLITRDITDLKAAEESLRQQATTDILTGLPNRAILHDRLSHGLARCARNGGGLAVLFIDLDYFKAVNDELGHEAGDELLEEVAHRLWSCVRGSDTAARIGGDEFVVLAEPVVRFEDAKLIGERIVRSIAKPFELTAGVARIGASVGLAVSERGSTARALLHAADLAAYQAKSEGRSRVAVAPPLA